MDDIHLAAEIQGPDVVHAYSMLSQLTGTLEQR